LIQKIKLSQPEISYKNKELLLKRTVFQKAISLSFIGLSAAAAIALLVLLVPFSPEKRPENPLAIAEGVNKDTSVIIIKRETIPDNASKEKIKTGKPSRKKIILQTNNTVLAESAQVIIPGSTDTLNFSREEEINKVYFSSPININSTGEPHTLIASSASVELPYYDDGRSNISRLIARTFRDKFLKEDISKDTPLKGYEIAEAGVTGLNKLLGWDMAIDKNNDINGELNSVYFSSKILKFNTPVKKTEPSE
jgi:hypothetical protein